MISQWSEFPMQDDKIPCTVAADPLLELPVFQIARLRVGPGKKCELSRYSLSRITPA
jgi:hypothetical protein